MTLPSALDDAAVEQLAGKLRLALNGQSVAMRHSGGWVLWLAVYLAHGESQVATAQELFVRQKTVAYRVRQAEKLLGRKIGERRSELEAALLVHRAFDGDV